MAEYSFTSVQQGAVNTSRKLTTAVPAVSELKWNTGKRLLLLCCHRVSELKQTELKQDQTSRWKITLSCILVKDEPCFILSDLGTAANRTGRCLNGLKKGVEAYLLIQRNTLSLRLMYTVKNSFHPKHLGKQYQHIIFRFRPRGFCILKTRTFWGREAGWFSVMSLLR